jgi:hypothetical protein
VPGGFSPLPHVRHENPEADTHVESHDDVLSDAGSTPAASTNLDQERRVFSATRLCRLQNVPTLHSPIPAFEQPDPLFDGGRAQVHVALRRREIRMPR